MYECVELCIEVLATSKLAVFWLPNEAAYCEQGLLQEQRRRRRKFTIPKKLLKTFSVVKRSSSFQFWNKNFALNIFLLFSFFRLFLFTIFSFCWNSHFLERKKERKKERKNTLTGILKGGIRWFHNLNSSSPTFCLSGGAEINHTIFDAKWVWSFAPTTLPSRRWDIKKH